MTKATARGFVASAVLGPEVARVVAAAERAVELVSDVPALVGLDGQTTAGARQR